MQKLIAANWKMNKTTKEAVKFIDEFKKLIKNIDAEIVICPPFTILNETKKLIKNSKIKLGAQNMHFEDSGAFTGEVSPLMLKEIGCEYVILGHSERREFFNESDDFINKKVIAALNHGLKPILCIGENLEQRNQGKAKNVVESQLKVCLKNIGKNQMTRINIAYEPVWAISRGNPNTKPATKEDAEEGHKFVRNVLEKMFDSATAKKTRVIYGGSLKPENAKELLSMPNINGGLVGNASLNEKSFAEIVKATK